MIINHKVSSLSGLVWSLSWVSEICKTRCVSLAYSSTAAQYWVTACCWCLVAYVVSDSLQSHVLLFPRLLCPWNSPGKSTGVSFHALLQGIFSTQGSNPGHLRCRQILWATNEPPGKSWIATKPGAVVKTSLPNVSWWVQFLVRELRSHIHHNQNTKMWNRNNIKPSSIKTLKKKS